MAETHVITGLKARRASIAAEIDELERQRRQLLASLRHVDGALKVMGFDGNPEGINSPRKRRYLFRRGQLTRFIYNAEREHGANISHKNIATVILKKMGWKFDSVTLMKVTASVRSARFAIKRRRAASSLSTDEIPARS